MARRDAAASVDSLTRGPSTETPFWLLPLLTGLLVCSGVCALIYQVLWLRLLSLTFGVTTHAASTVLASFMGGLALGSFVAGRLADRVRQAAVPVRSRRAVDRRLRARDPGRAHGRPRLFVGIAGRLPDSVALGTIVRLILSFAVLLVPTALMGATLPIVVKSSLSRARSHRHSCRAAVCGQHRGRDPRRDVRGLLPDSPDRPQALVSAGGVDQWRRRARRTSRRAIPIPRQTIRCRRLTARRTVRRRGTGPPRRSCSSSSACRASRRWRSR